MFQRANVKNAVELQHEHSRRLQKICQCFIDFILNPGLGRELIDKLHEIQFS